MKSFTTRATGKTSRPVSGAEFSYRELDINQKINLKGIVAGWNPIAIERFQRSLQQKVYAESPRDSKAKRRRQSYASRRTMRLLRDWRSRLYGDKNGGLLGTQLSFLLYGRFVDMGVGNGIDAAEAKWKRTRKNGEPVRRRAKRWYPNTLGHETHRLRELLAQHYVDISLQSLESFLDGSITIHV